MMSYAASARLGMGKGKNDGWFVGYAPRRNPEIIVAAMVSETTEHGGTVAGPVVRDIVKAYYDKKNKKNQGQVTAQEQPSRQMEKSQTGAVPEETAEVVAGGEKKKARPE
jgi:hypothetical protein